MVLASRKSGKGTLKKPEWKGTPTNPLLPAKFSQEEGFSSKTLYHSFVDFF